MGWLNFKRELPSSIFPLAVSWVSDLEPSLIKPAWYWPWKNSTSSGRQTVQNLRIAVKQRITKDCQGADFVFKFAVRAPMLVQPTSNSSDVNRAVFWAARFLHWNSKIQKLTYPLWSHLLVAVHVWVPSGRKSHQLTNIITARSVLGSRGYKSSVCNKIRKLRLIGVKKI